MAAVVALVAAVGVGCTPGPAWGPGPVARDAPVQTASLRTPWRHVGLAVEPLADYELRARVLSVRAYPDDPGSAVSPLDVAVGWGAMSDESVLNRLTIRQAGRWYHYRWTGSPPAPARHLAGASANMHLIPATAGVARQLETLRANDVVRLQGALVAVRMPQGWSWRSSLSRNDIGQGACELMWVERVEREPPPLD